MVPSPRTIRNEPLIAAARTLANTPWCDDYEKMMSGMIYNSFAPELVEGRLRARKLVKKYNDYLPDDASDASWTAGREEMLRGLLGRVGKGINIDPPFHVDYGCNISIGDDFYGNFNMTILDCAAVTIGDRVKFGPNVSIFAATHPTSPRGRREGVDYSREVTVGSDCWIGGHTVIMLGVTIGDGVTVGAGSVVTRDIPSWSIAVGAPAKVVREVPESER